MNTTQNPAKDKKRERPLEIVPKGRRKNQKEKFNPDREYISEAVKKYQEEGGEITDLNKVRGHLTQSIPCDSADKWLMSKSHYGKLWRTYVSV